MSYGIYTGGDRSYFAGMAAAIRSLRSQGCGAPVAVLDMGLDDWMVDWLEALPEVRVFDMIPLANVIRYTDIRSDRSPVWDDCGFKAFGIVHFNLFECFTFIDADFLPVCNLREELEPAIRAGEFVASEDGENRWDSKHTESIGVKAGTYLNLNAGFFSLSMAHHAWLMHEWRSLHTRRQAMDLLFADQGALNVILDKYEISKTVLDRLRWNQTGLNRELAASGEVGRREDGLVYLPTGDRIHAWHGSGKYKLWHQAGIDFCGNGPAETERLRRESENSSPPPVVELFAELLTFD